jgi:hypothetical protein
MIHDWDTLALTTYLLEPFYPFRTTTTTYPMHRPFRINKTMNNQKMGLQRNHQQPARRCRRCCRPSDRSFIRTILLLAVLLSTFLSTTDAQFCRPVSSNPLHPATWAQFETAVQESYGLAILCPFEISGDRCGDTNVNADTTNDNDNNAPKEGLVVESSLYIFCDANLQGPGCTIHCPGRHFTVRSTAQLTLDGFILSGATESSIEVKSNGYVRVINSAFQE